jgi:hypothetical protein
MGCVFSEIIAWRDAYLGRIITWREVCFWKSVINPLLRIQGYIETTGLANPFMITDGMSIHDHGWHVSGSA